MDDVRGMSRVSWPADARSTASSCACSAALTSPPATAAAARLQRRGARAIDGRVAAAFASAARARAEPFTRAGSSSSAAADVEIHVHAKRLFAFGFGHGAAVLERLVILSSLGVLKTTNFLARHSGWRHAWCAER